MVTFGNNTNTDSLNFTYTNDGNLVLAFVCHKPSDEVSVDNFELVEMCSIENAVSISLFKKSTTDADVPIIVNSSGSEEKLTSVCSFQNVASGIFNITSGVGKVVSQISLNSFFEVGGLTMGVGAVDNINAHAINLSQAQTQRWAFSGTTLKSEAISASLNMNIPSIPVENSISETSNYAIIIIGVV
jgi:hypothetical protein